jgi:hypothetical protein
VRFLVLIKDVIHRIDSVDAEVDAEDRNIRVELIPEDQREIDSKRERLCQLSFIRSFTPWPVLFTLIQGETLSDLIPRIAKSFDLLGADSKSMRLFKPNSVQRLGVNDIPWDVYPESLEIVKIFWPSPGILR